MPYSAARKHMDRSIGLFTLVLLAVFATEMAVTELFGALGPRTNQLWSGLADALLLMLFLTPPLWAICRAQHSPTALEVATGVRLSGADRNPQASLAAVAKVLFGIFLVEFLVTLILYRLPPFPQEETRDLLDACLVTLFSAPPLWWLLFRRKAEPRVIPLSEVLGIPLRLYVLLLLLIFGVELVQQAVLAHRLPSVTQCCEMILQAFLTTVVISPLLWLFVIRPLKKGALSDRVLASAIHDQVTDAVATIAPDGTIISFNPAAERVFGYQSHFIIGEPAQRLFLEGAQGLDELLPAAGSDQGEACREVTGKRSDGSPVTLEISISRAPLEMGGYLLIMRDISDRKRAEQVLLESLSLQKATLESSADGILVVDLSYRVRSYNQKFLQMWRIPPDLVQEGGYQVLKAELLAQLDQPAEILARMEQFEDGPDQTTALRLQDGRVFECYSCPQMLDARVVGRVWSFRDISAKNQAEKALRESEELFRQVFDQTEDAIIFFVVGTCAILDLNAKAERVFGYPKAELLVLGFESICRSEDLAAVAAAISGITSERGAQLDNIATIRKDGSEILVSMRGKIMTLRGSQVVYCTFRDVTDRVMMEREARNIQSRLIQANKMTSLGLLVSGVAHEINNPNNYIMANARLLSHAWRDALRFLQEYYRENGEFLLGGVPFSELDAHSEELFEGILDGTQRIDAIINNLKGFARQDRAVASAEVDLNMVANSAVTLLHHELVKFTSNFHVKLARDLPKVTGSSQQLGQVMINLLTNACHALPDKSCGIWLQTGYDPQAGEVTFSIKDEGCGITRDDGSRIMEPFFTTKLDSGGTGLGLSICCSIIKDHAGSLCFSSEPGKGTTFTVTLPARERAEAGPEAGSRQAVSGTGG